MEEVNQYGAIGIPQWKPRSHTGIYLIHSRCRSGLIALVLNIKIGLVSPQFHFKFDNDFTTGPYLTKDETPLNWLSLIEHTTEKTLENNHKLHSDWLHPPPLTDYESSDKAPMITTKGHNFELSVEITYGEKRCKKIPLYAKYYYDCTKKMLHSVLNLHTHISEKSKNHHETPLFIFTL